MNRLRNLNSLLVEIMIAVLFFALGSTVILEMFVVAKDYSHIAGIDTAAMIEMQSLAERLYAEDAPAALLAAEGYVLQDDVWVENHLCDQEQHDFKLQVRLAKQEAPAGMLYTSVIQAVRGGEIVAEIPGIRYESLEVSE